MTAMVEAMLDDLGHEVVGVADTTADGVHLLLSTRPDVVIVDLSLGYNTDFDPVATAEDVGARVIVFAYNADDAIMSQYPIRPAFVPKPDMSDLERVVSRLVIDHTSQVVDHDRRVRPVRAASGPPPTSMADAQSFYVALNDAIEGDAVLSIDLDISAPGSIEGPAVGAHVQEVLRATDRLLASSTALKVFLPGAGEEGVASLFRRLDAAGAVPTGATTRHVIVRAGELPADAFDRLKHTDA
jgi:chemotaxis response regulator CheB